MRQYGIFAIFSVFFLFKVGADTIVESSMDDSIIPVKPAPFVANQIPIDIGKISYLIWHKSQVSWADALRICEQQNMKLLSLETKEKNDVLTKYLSEQGFVDDTSPGARYIYWTSGNDNKKEGTFVWETLEGEKREFNETNWLTGMPDNWRGDENCVEMGFRHVGKWNDGRCYHQRHFICERERFSENSNTY